MVLRTCGQKGELNAPRTASGRRGADLPFVLLSLRTPPTKGIATCAEARPPPRRPRIRIRAGLETRLDRRISTRSCPPITRMIARCSSRTASNPPSITASRAHIDHQALDVGPGNVAQLHATHPGLDMPIDADAIDPESRCLLQRRTLGHVELAEITHGHLASPLHIVGLRTAASSGLGDGEASPLSRFFGGNDAMRGQRHQPVSAAMRPESGEVGSPALRGDPHTKPLEVGIPHDVALVPGLQSLDDSLREPFGHHMATRHVSSITPRRG